MVAPTGQQRLLEVVVFVKVLTGCGILQRFKLTMRELQGAIIIGSAFQTFLGYSGAMSILLRYLLVANFPVERVPRY